MAADTLVGEDAMGAGFDTIDNVLTAARPEKPHADPKECLIDAKNVKDKAA
jgi:hypothetical protein